MSKADDRRLRLKGQEGGEGHPSCPSYIRGISHTKKFPPKSDASEILMDMGKAKRKKEKESKKHKGAKEKKNYVLTKGIGWRGRDRRQKKSEVEEKAKLSTSQVSSALAPLQALHRLSYR